MADQERQQLGTCDTQAWPHNQDDEYPIRHKQLHSCIGWKPLTRVSQGTAPAMPEQGCKCGMCIMVAEMHGYCKHHHPIMSNTGHCEGCREGAL